MIRMCPLGASGPHVVCAHNVFTMCPLGMWALVPSVWDSDLLISPTWFVTLEFSGTLDFLDPFRKNSRNSGLHTDPRICRTFSSDFTFSSFQHTSNRTAVNSCQLDSVLDPWTHKHVRTPAGVTFMTEVQHTVNQSHQELSQLLRHHVFQSNNPQPIGQGDP